MMIFIVARGFRSALQLYRFLTGNLFSEKEVCRGKSPISPRFPLSHNLSRLTECERKGERQRKERQRLRETDQERERDGVAKSQRNPCSISPALKVIHCLISPVSVHGSRRRPSPLASPPRRIRNPNLSALRHAPKCSPALNRPTLMVYNATVSRQVFTVG